MPLGGGWTMAARTGPPKYPRLPLAGACFAHDFAALDRLVLPRRRCGPAVGKQLLRRQRAVPTRMGVEDQHEGSPLLHDPHSRMAVSVNTPFVPLGLAEP